MTLRESILSANDCEKQPIDVPEWGSPPVFIKVWNGATRDSYDQWGQSRKSKSFEGVRAHVVRLSLVDAEGKDVFQDVDEPGLQTKSASALNRIFQASFRLNRLGADDTEDAKKNSKSDQSDDSGSA